MAFGCSGFRGRLAPRHRLEEDHKQKVVWGVDRYCRLVGVASRRWSGVISQSGSGGHSQGIIGKLLEVPSLLCLKSTLVAPKAMLNEA